MAAIKAPVADDFPNIYNNPFGRWTLEIAPFEEANPIGIMGSLIAMGAGASTGKPTITTIKGSLSFNIWPILAGISGGGGKGDATSSAKAIWNKALPGWYSAHMKAGFDTGLGVIQHMGDNRDQEGKPIDLLIFESEVSRIIAQMASDTRMMTTFTKLYDRDVVSYMSGKEKVEIHDPYAVILGHVQPKLFIRTKKTKAADTGVWNRFIFLYVAQAQELDLFASLEEKARVIEDIADDITRAHAYAQFVGDVKVPKAVSDKIRTFYRPKINAITRQTEEIYSYTQRGLANFLKLSALYAAWSGRRYLTMEDTDSAFALIQYSVESIKYILSNESVFTGRTTLAEKVLNFVKDNGPCSYTFMTTKLGRHHDKAAYISALLEVEGEVVLYTRPPGKGKGRTGRGGAWYVAHSSQVIPDDAVPLTISEVDPSEVDSSSGVPGFKVEEDTYTVEQVDDLDDDDEPVEVELVESDDQEWERIHKAQMAREASETPAKPLKSLPAPTPAKKPAKPAAARTAPPKTTQPKPTRGETGHKVTNGRPAPTRTRPPVAVQAAPVNDDDGDDVSNWF